MISIEALLSSVGVALQLSVCVPQLYGSLDIGMWRMRYCLQACTLVRAGMVTASLLLPEVFFVIEQKGRRGVYAPPLDKDNGCLDTDYMAGCRGYPCSDKYWLFCGGYR
jgi:hypothetical protein